MNLRYFRQVAIFVVLFLITDAQNAPYLRHAVNYMQAYNGLAIDSIVWVTDEASYVKYNDPCQDIRTIATSKKKASNGNSYLIQKLRISEFNCLKSRCLGQFQQHEGGLSAAWRLALGGGELVFVKMEIKYGMRLGCFTFFLPALKKKAKLKHFLIMHEDE